MKVVNQSNNIQFGSQALRFLATDAGVGAVALDLASMSIPRTVTDVKNRGPVLGAETARRELSGSTNFALTGTYGLLAGHLLSTKINKDYDIKAQKVFASSKFIDEIGKKFAKNVGAEDAVVKTFADVLGDAEVYGKKIDPEVVNTVTNLYRENIDKMCDKAAVKKLKTLAKAHITRATGSETGFKFGSTVTLDTFLDGTFNILESFKSKKVVQSFVEDGGKTFLKSLKRPV